MGTTDVAYVKHLGKLPAAASSKRQAFTEGEGDPSSLGHFCAAPGCHEAWDWLQSSMVSFLPPVGQELPLKEASVATCGSVCPLVIDCNGTLC